ncbi:MAG: histidine kinase [Alphaproteobacteria bacterium]|nr:histidine kinase [Alphaproteobacteria bacterium]
MALIRSSDFASVISSGDDWRDICKTALGQLEPALRDRNRYTIGFLYISDLLHEEATSILNLFRSVTEIEHWVGCLGMGICGPGEEYLDNPAISVMIGRIDPAQFAILPAGGLDDDARAKSLKTWIDTHDTMLTVLHGNPETRSETMIALEQIQRRTAGFPVGGMASSRSDHLLIADTVSQGSYAGVIFDAGVPVSTTLSQGCSPIGPVHTVTRCEGNTVIELDNQRALEVLAFDLKTMAVEEFKADPDEVALVEGAGDLATLPVEAQKLLLGEVHVAFPVPGSDQRDYVVRNILETDPDFGHVTVAHMVEPGSRILFVRRDVETIRADLARALIALRKRVTAERGVFEPKGALYVSCLARAFTQNDEQPLDEMKLVREIIGDVPLAGFYANGEIFNSRLYSYTGVLTLFF